MIIKINKAILSVSLEAGFYQLGTSLKKIKKNFVIELCWGGGGIVQWTHFARSDQSRFDEVGNSIDLDLLIQ